MRPGNYELYEIKAPDGYELDMSPIIFSIELSQTETQILTVKNKKIINKYTVTYKSSEHESGDIPVDSNEYEENDIDVLKDATMTRPGYVFVGWGYEGNILDQGSDFTMPAKDVVFVAIWEEDKDPTDPTDPDPTDPDPTDPDPTDPDPTDPDPTDPDPTDPDPTDPEPTDPSEPTDPTTPANPNEVELPKTGIMSWQPLAYLMILVGAGILILFKRKSKI